MRMYQCFRTKEEQKAWEKEQKSKNSDFRVCMRMTAKQLEKDLCMANGTFGEYKHATIYSYELLL